MADKKPDEDEEKKPDDEKKPEDDIPGPKPIIKDKTPKPEIDVDKLDIKKVPVAKLRVAPSTIVLEAESNDSLEFDRQNKEIQKYQVYLGGYSKDHAREKYLKQKAKERKEKRAKEKKEKEKKIKEKLEEEKKQAVLDAKDAKVLPVSDRRKMKLLRAGKLGSLEDEDELVYYNNPRTRIYLIIVFILMEAFGVAMLTLTPVFSILESGSIELYLERGIKRKNKTIHYTIAALWIFIWGNGFIVFRITSAYKQTVLKWIHALTYAFVLPLPLYCVNAYFDVKEENADIHVQEHYYSLHSFLGFLTTYLFIFELCCGVIVYTLFFFRPAHRNLYYQVHTYISLLGFIMAVTTFCCGVTMEENDIRLKSSSPTDEVLHYLHLAGCFCCLFAAFALFLIINPDFDMERELTVNPKNIKK